MRRCIFFKDVKALKILDLNIDNMAPNHANFPLFSMSFQMLWPQYLLAQGSFAEEKSFLAMLSSVRHTDWHFHWKHIGLQPDMKCDFLRRSSMKRTRIRPWSCRSQLVEIQD